MTMTMTMLGNRNVIAPPRRIDRRRKMAREARDLANAFAAKLGGWESLDRLQAVEINRAAELAAAAAAERAKFLRGEPINYSVLASLEDVVDRAMRSLGLRG